MSILANQFELKKVIKACSKNIQGLLNSVSLLLKDDTTLKYALGLYMYAVEEYGKANLLRSYLRNKDEPKEYSIPSSIFGRGASGKSVHIPKIEEGFKHLPADCQILSPVLRVKFNSSSITQEFTLQDGQKIAVAPYTTGFFEETSVTKKYIEFQFKTECFYVDWDTAKGKEIDIQIDVARMELNVKIFREKIESDEFLN